MLLRQPEQHNNSGYLKTKKHTATVQYINILLKSNIYILFKKLLSSRKKHTLHNVLPVLLTVMYFISIVTILFDKLCIGVRQLVN